MWSWYSPTTWHDQVLPFFCIAVGRHEFHRPILQSLDLLWSGLPISERSSCTKSVFEETNIVVDQKVPVGRRKASFPLSCLRYSFPSLYLFKKQLNQGLARMIINDEYFVSVINENYKRSWKLKMNERKACRAHGTVTGLKVRSFALCEVEIDHNYIPLFASLTDLQPDPNCESMDR